MAKRKSLYKDTDFKNVKKEIEKNIVYLKKQTIESFTDDLDWNTTSNGGRILIVVASIEQKLNSYITLIKDSIEQLSYIVAGEGVTDFVVNNLQVLKKMLERMHKYYDSTPPDKITTREYYEERTSKSGKTTKLKRIAANIPTQLTSRSKIQKIILQLQPEINSLENTIQEEIQLRGDKEIPLLYKLLNYA